MSCEYINPFNSNNVSNTTTANFVASIATDDFNASIMQDNSSTTENHILTSSDLTEDDIELRKKELKRKIQEQKSNLENEKNSRGWLTSAWNGIKGWFGAGDKKIEDNIENYEALLEGLNSDTTNIDEIYKTIMGSELDSASLQTLKSSETLNNSLDLETQNAIIIELENQVETLESNFETAKNSNGWISGTWNWFKNWTGIGASSNKTTAEINNLKEQITLLKNGEADLATTYKNITGTDLNSENLTSLLSGEEGTGLDSISTAGQSLNNYSEGQKMCTDVVGDMVSGIVAVGAVAFGSALGICAAPFTAGASLGLVAAGLGIAAGAGAAVKIAIKSSDCIGNEKTYSLKDLGYDVITGSINGAAAPLTNALGGAAGTGVMKALGQEALETTVKSGALIASKEIVEESVEQAGKKLVSKGLAKAVSFAADSMVDGSLSGFIDGSSRALAEGRYEDIVSDGLEGFGGGLVAAPIMGAGFNLAGKAGSKLGQTALGEATGNILKEGAQALGNTIDNVLPQGVKRIIQEGSEKLNNKFIQTSFKNCLTISDNGIYSVKTNGYNVQLLKSELSEEILDAIAKGDNTSIFKYAQDVLTMELRKKEIVQYIDTTIFYNKFDEACCAIIKLNDENYSKALAMITHYPESIKEINSIIQNLNPELHSSALDILSEKNYCVKGLCGIVEKLDPSLHSKALDMITNSKIDYDFVNRAIEKLDPSLHSKALDMITNHPEMAMTISDFVRPGNKIVQKKELTLLDKGIKAYDMLGIICRDDELYTKTLTVLESGKNITEINLAIRGIDGSYEFLKALNLLETYDSKTANILARVDGEQETRILNLLKGGADISDIEWAISRPYTLWRERERGLDLLEQGVKNIQNIARLNEAQYSKYRNILKQNNGDAYKNILSNISNTKSLCAAMDLSEILIQNNKFSNEAIECILLSTNSTNLQAKIDIYNFLKQEEVLESDVIAGVLSCWQTEINQQTPFIKNKNIFSKIATDESISVKAKELLLCKILNINNDVEFSKLTLKEKINKINLLREAQKADIFTNEEKNFLNIDSEIAKFQKLIENVINVTPVSKEASFQMMRGFFANNNPKLDNLLSTTNFAQFGKEGLPLAYSRSSFINDLQNTIKDLSTNEQADILRKLGITLTNNTTFQGYDGIIDLSKLSTEGTEGEVLSIATKFIKENSINTGNNELDEALNSLIKGMPEFINIIGKQQHETQDFSVDIHMLTVLKEAMSNPNYQNLSNYDKFCLKLATILHDVAKSEGIVDTGHAEICALYARDILQKFRLSTGEKDRIYELIKNHHWLANYNTKNTSASQTAALFRRTGDLKIAQIMAEADLKGIKADGSFYKRYASALSEEMQTPIQEALTSINANGQLFLPNKIINSSKIPTIEYNGQQYQVINFTELPKDFDLQQYGFESGATVDNLRLFIHMTNTPEVTRALNNPSIEGYLCASYGSIENHPTYRNLQFGVSLEVEQANIGDAAPRNQASGTGKNFSRFSDTIAHDRQYRNLVPNSIKQTLNLTNDEYSELFTQIQRLKYISQLDYISEIKISNKTFTGTEIKEAILKADDLMMESNKHHNEANLYLPKINAVVAKVSKLENIPQEFLDFAQEYNLPIYLIGE